MRPLPFLLAALCAGPALAEKPSASVLDPKVTGLPGEEAEILGEAVRDTVVGAAKYRVQDRAAMREILAQQQLNQSDLCDDSCAVEQGRLLQVRFLVSSTARRVGETTWVSIRMTDVETGEVVGTTRGSCKCTLEDMVPLAENLTRQVLGGSKEAPPEPARAQSSVASAAPPPPTPSRPATPPRSIEPYPVTKGGFRFGFGAGLLTPQGGAGGGVIEVGVSAFSLRVQAGYLYGPSGSAGLRYAGRSDGSSWFAEAGGGLFEESQPFANPGSAQIEENFTFGTPMIYGLAGWRLQFQSGLYAQAGLGAGFQLPPLKKLRPAVNLELGYSIQ